MKKKKKIYLALQTTKQLPTTNKVQLNKMPDFFKWEENSDQAFNAALSFPVIKHNIEETNKLITDSKHPTDIYNLTTRFTTILVKAATITLKIKKKKTTPKAKWFTGNLKRMEREVNRKAVLMANLQTGEARRGFFLALKAYRQTKKYPKRQFIKQQMDDLEKLKAEDPRQFWNLLQNINGKTSNTDNTTKILPGQWYYYLMTSNKNPHPENPELQEELLENLRHKTFNELDFSIKQEEIKQAIKRLKNNKAVGLDKISNEMLKTSMNKLLYVY